MPAVDPESVRDWRRRRMLTQQEVADLAGTSLFTIQRIERGEGGVRPQTGRAVAQALGVSPEEILPKAQAPLPFEEPSESVASRWRGLQVATEQSQEKMWAEVRARENTGDVDGAIDAVRERLLEMCPAGERLGDVVLEGAMGALAKLGADTLESPEIMELFRSSWSTGATIADLLEAALALGRITSPEFTNPERRTADALTGSDG